MMLPCCCDQQACGPPTGTTGHILSSQAVAFAPIRHDAETWVNMRPTSATELQPGLMPHIESFTGPSPPSGSIAVPTGEAKDDMGGWSTSATSHGRPWWQLWVGLPYQGSLFLVWWGASVPSSSQWQLDFELELVRVGTKRRHEGGFDSLDSAFAGAVTSGLQRGGKRQAGSPPLASASELETRRPQGAPDVSQSSSRTAFHWHRCSRR